MTIKTMKIDRYNEVQLADLGKGELYGSTGVMNSSFLDRFSKHARSTEICLKGNISKNV